MAQFRQTVQERNARPNDRFQSDEPVLDADFETVEAAPKASLNSGAMVDTPDKVTPKLAIEKTGMSVFGKKYAKPLRDDSIAFYGFSAALVMLSFWVSGGYSLFRQIDRMPTSGIQLAASSEIVDASWRVVSADGKSALHVEGIVRNSGKAAVHTNPVTVTVKHNDGSAKRYLLGQKGWTLGPGQEVVVSGRLDIASASIASVVIALSN